MPKAMFYKVRNRLDNAAIRVDGATARVCHEARGAIAATDSDLK
jgi:hypothetical protein